MNQGRPRHVALPSPAVLSRLTLDATLLGVDREPDRPTLLLISVLVVLTITAIGAAVALGAIPTWLGLASIGAIFGVILVLLVVELATYRAPTPEARRLLRRCWIAAGVGVGLALLVIPAAIVSLRAAAVLFVASLATIGVTGRVFFPGVLPGTRSLGFGRRLSYNTIFGMIAGVCMAGNVIGGFLLFVFNDWFRHRITIQLDAMLGADHTPHNGAEPSDPPP